MISIRDNRYEAILNISTCQPVKTPFFYKEDTLSKILLTTGFFMLHLFLQFFLWQFQQSYEDMRPTQLSTQCVDNLIFRKD
jgi:hypothetical protein